MISVEKIIGHIKDIVNSVDVNVEQGIIFGSTATGERTEKSDTDVILISTAFENTKIYKRTPPFLDAWDNIKYGPVEFICLTPSEFKSKKKKEGSTYKDADEEGIKIEFNST